MNASRFSRSVSGYRVAAFIVVLIAINVSGTLQAQEAALFLQPHHWAYQALRRIDAGTQAPILDLAGNTMSVFAAAARLRAAASAGPPSGRAMAASYLERLETEFPGVTVDAGSILTHASAQGGGFRERGIAAPGAGFFHGEDWTGARPLPGRDGPYAAATLALSSGNFGAQLTARIEGDEANLRDTYGIARIGKVGFWAGNRTLRLGATSTGFVLSGAVDFNGGGFALQEAVVLPWVLRYLGPVRFETFLSKMDRNGIINDPWFWGARGSLQPLPNLILGINRASIFGGEGNEVTLRDVLEMIAGGYGGDVGEFENQVLSVDLRVVAPSDAQPVEFFAEWGADDSSGAWYKTPAITAGVALPYFGSWPHGSASIEGTVMYEKPDCCNTYWYRSVFFRGPWAKDDILLGHPLGGHGKEVRIRFGVDALAARLRAQSTLYARQRGTDNVFSPEREGASLGAALNIEWNWGRFEGSLRSELEAGDGWRATSLRAGVRRFF